MIEIAAFTNSQILDGLKGEYLARTTAPLDGMWLSGFLPTSNHFGIRADSQLIGYCCVNDEGFVLQFYVGEDSNRVGSAILAGLIKREYEQLPEINGAFVSTAEPGYLLHCLDCFGSFEVNALMYQLGEASRESYAPGTEGTLETLRLDQLSEAVAFASNAIGAPESWLNQYYSNLIERQELFGCWKGGALIGTGEHRINDAVQPGISDVGVIVGQEHRGKGLATSILRQLVQKAVDRDLRPICSTERENIGAQKAIARAGFVSRNRIIQFRV